MVATEGGKPVRDADGRLKPAIDYPFAEDGLDIWYAMHQWFGNYLRLYYDDNTPDKKVRYIGLSQAGGLKVDRICQL